MDIQPFRLERWLNNIEGCEIDAAQGSGIQVQLKDITTEIDYNKIMTYGVTSGSDTLRSEIAEWYNLEPENVLVTSGTSEANLISNLCLLDRGDEYIGIYPMYKQTVGFVKYLGCKVKEVFLNEENGWCLDINALQEMISMKTKVIFFDHPNNPTGAILSEKEIQAICDIAKDIKSYVICDNALKGSELCKDEVFAPFDYYERGVITGSVSKLGMIGLRIGWLIGNKEFVSKCIRFKDYTTLSHSGISEYLAELILEKHKRNKFIQRNLDLNRGNLKILSKWIIENNDLLTCFYPKAGFTAFPSYNIPISSEEFCKRLLTEERVLFSPGIFFGVDKHFRINIGLRKGLMNELLNRLTKFFNRLQ